MTPGAQLPGGLHFTGDTVVGDPLDLHDHGAIVDQQGIAHAHVIDQAGVVDGSGTGQVRLTSRVTELDLVTFIQHEGLGQGAGTDGGALQVEEETHRAGPRGIGGGFPHAGGHLTGPFVRCVAHVKPEGVRARVDEGVDGLKGFGGRAEGGDESGTAHGMNL